MGNRGIVAAFKAWLPINNYRFVGGPFDGEVRTVDLYETVHGMEPPRIWRIADTPKFPQPSAHPSPVTADVVVNVHDYEFVPTRSFNEGYYRHIA